VPGAAVTELESLVSLLAGAPEAIVDPRPVGARPERIDLLDGASLDLSKRPQLAGDGDVEPDRVAQLLAALAAPGTPVPLPTARPRGQLFVTLAGSGVLVTLDLYPDDVVARRGEPIALRLAPDAYARLVASSRALQDVSLWAVDPTAITALAIDGVRVARGDVLGEWTGGGDAQQLEQLAAALAAPRARGTDAPPPPAAPGAHLHHVVVEVHDPIGPPARHELDLEAIGARCALRTADHRAAWVAPAACAAVAHLAPPR
jgi:hypothetical protein